MPTQKFIEINFRRDSRDMLVRCNAILDEYQAQGLRLSLRQLFYQLVSRAIIPNTLRSYKNLGNLISNGRLAGVLDWDAIEDRLRQPVVPLEFADTDELIENAMSWYRLPRRKGQEIYAELWVEKDALAGVLRPIANAAHVTMMVNRGNSSQSAMYDSMRRFVRAERNDAECVLFYLGDLDPSGDDMVRDIEDRLEMMRANVEVRKLAINPDQIAQYTPPPNPVKMTDSRARAFIAKYGNECYEVDALPPNVLAQIITDALEDVTDQEKVDSILGREEQDKELLRDAAEWIVERRSSLHDREFDDLDGR